MTEPDLEAARGRVLELEQAVAGRPEDPATHAQLAEAYEQLARDNQKAAQASAPTAGGAIHVAVESIGLRRKAVDAWTEASRLAPEGAGHHAGRGRALSRLAASLTAAGSGPEVVLEAIQAAADAYAQALAIDPDNGDVHLRRGALLSTIGHSAQRNSDRQAALARYREALIDLKAAQRLAPTNPAAVSEAGWVLVRMGSVEQEVGRAPQAIADLESAIALFAELRRLTPGKSFGPLSQGQAYTALGDVQAAQPGLPGASADRGIGSYRQALACFDSVLSTQPGDTVIAAVKAEALQGLGELHVLASRGVEALTAYREALAIYEGTLAGNTQSFQYQIGRGRSLLRAGELAADLNDEAASTEYLEAARAELSREVPIEAMAGAARAGLLERVERHLAGETGADAEPEPRPN